MIRTLTLSPLLRFLACVAALFAFALPAAQAQQMVSVDRDVINLRTGPGTEHEAVWRLNRGYPLMVISRKGDWLQVRDFENDSGWVLASLTARKPHFVTKAQDVNLRAGPGTNHKAVAKIQYGEVLKSLEQRGSWARVSTPSGETGWIARSLLWGW